MEIVLASGSVWRKGLLEAVGIGCSTYPPDVDESAIVGDTPRDVARARAAAKAAAVAPRIEPGAVVIGADQVVHLEGRILGKPRDQQAHLSMLRGLRGRRHELITAVALFRSGPKALLHRRFEEITHLRMRADLTDAELEAYVACGEASGCGGGYMVESLGAQLFEGVEGDWYNVVGLPLFALIGELRSMGWRPSFGPRAGVKPPSV
jgi:septum formation protein